MIKILISLFNSLFFLGMFMLIFRNWAVAGIVGGVAMLITLGALCLSTMSHRSDILDVRDRPQPSYQDSFGYIPHGARSRDYSLISTPAANPNKLTGRKESAYWKNN